VSATYLSKLFFLLDSRFQQNSTPVNSSNLLAQEYQERRERESITSQLQEVVAYIYHAFNGKH